MYTLETQMKTPSLIGHSVEDKRAELTSYFLNSWTSYDALFGLINHDDAYYLRPEPLRHPLIFYYGHTATFYVNKLMLGKYINERLNERLEAICAVGVDEMSWDDLDSTHYDWPSVNEVREYRQQVKRLVCQLIDEMDLSLPIKPDSLAWIILMGTEHERIHLETSSVIMRMLPIEYLTANDHWHTCPHSGLPPNNRVEPIAGATVTLGKQKTDTTYGWDNEYGQASIDVPDFSASTYLVSNQEYMSFVDAGGYQNDAYWTDEGKKWLTYKQPNMPRFWLKKDNEYYQRNLLNIIPLPLNWPVEVNYLEAKAFCHWKSAHENAHIRLPSEPEWYVLHNTMTEQTHHAVTANTNLAAYCSSCPVDEFKQGKLYDIVGNVWQWTESEIDAFEGFKVHPLYDDFSTPTFDGQHNLIKGGSWISTGNETIKSARYAFRRHFFQHAGFRYVQSKTPTIPKIAVHQFETTEDICQQIASHYGQPQWIQQNYPLAVANTVRDWVAQYQTTTSKVLDIGCSVGRTSFELAKTFDHVDGVDFSARLIQQGVKLQREKSIRYALVDEGEIVNYHEIQCETLDLPEGKNILFSQGDASNLKAHFTRYDLVLAQHLIETHYDPAAFFKHIHQRINPQGLLIVVTDFHFNESVITKNKWFGGIKVNGENMTGEEGLSQLLSAHFEYLGQDELTQELALNTRNVALSKKQLSVWRLK